MNPVMGPKSTLRDHFAGLAMQALIAANGDSSGIVQYVEEEVAKLAYKMADAMLAVRNEGA